MYGRKKNNAEDVASDRWYFNSEGERHNHKPIIILDQSS